MAGGTTYFTVFAGRRRYLSILLSYVQPLVEQRTVDHVHLWNYARLAPDREFLGKLQGRHRGIEVIEPPESDRHAKFPNKWKGCYAFYAARLATDDVLIKCDDDVVFLANVHVLLRTVRQDEGAHLLYFPSIVNNDVAAVFQAADGLITDPEYVVRMRASYNESRYSRSPLSDWYNCTACAAHVHAAFLARPAAFFTGCLHEWSTPARVPINFFAMRGDAAAAHFGAYMRESYVDEPYLTALLTERTRLPSVIVTDAVAVHFSFGFQHLPDERATLEAYARLADDAKLHTELRERFGARTPSRECPSAAPAALMLDRRQPPHPTQAQLAAARAGRARGRGRGRAAAGSTSGRGASGISAASRGSGGAPRKEQRAR